MPPSDVLRLRTDYVKGGLEDHLVDADPLKQLEAWLADAAAAHALEPNAMTLATVGRDGVPNGRIVLLRGLDARGLTFFTNRESQKGNELRETGRCALVFFWPELERQVRVQATVLPTSDEESAAYFASRPRKSQISAWASPQSRPVSGRAELEAKTVDLEAQFASGAVPLPPFWGGYRASPFRVEFWQGRPSRLHDRIAYERTEEALWTRKRIAP